ncbi:MULTISPECIES: NAD(P)/FAD-dependent oxidoreductase [Bacillus amyloliquefaciens group]|uniref:NAD(P)/FAD-dependent oxidoreductase n=1 Tax=Bacillus amyloliquefaciens group TaxID=1938374 RepID=UPI001361FC62|nr:MULTISPECIES: NAD(P)/FAD-dependent oxidoreductase [Bacillus amyloliquefaciens group]MBO3651406.1 NAD(P)/FAD-dependent oxidoreductase [Bacillus amyloliquefaciens]MCJ2173200.1 NAD(P)/FAD-dependent oxidoreductase [Bacillus amyloliquefaciens]MCR4349003.1 NAD(P)/FAD-dependent oxidoreductase [Bacillus amyloliquefaciens]MCR4355960.1 NAD(P)/FAD-dependent oxidoreductase [Bacillus amyloliquefaciens]MEC1479958.1 NAD(P)/FAD-dependent oxidoreductase [Bacillus velezensis]
MKHYDVIVIGGGPSGLMAAIAAGEEGADVLLIDKGNKLGRKLAISGGGRCNVTNRLPVEEIIKHIPGNGRFLYSAFSEFNNEDIIAFFEKLGIQLKEEDHGRMFPVTDKAQSVVDALLNRLKQLNVTIRTNEKIKEVRYENGRTAGITTNNDEHINADAVIIAVGGKSVPHTGSTGDGYAWAEAAGHTVTELFPTEVPVTSSEPFIKQKTLQGLSLRNAAVSVLNKKGKPIVTHVMDMLFTHFGLSGPAILRCSQFVVKELKKQPEVKLRIDLFPGINEEELFQKMHKELKDAPKKALKNALKPRMQERYLLFLLERNGLDPQTSFTELPKDQFRAFVKDCKQFTVAADGTLSLDKAFVTGGGVSVKEIEPKQMASKKMEGLYFCGEILDIHGYTGGYNITSAFVTGRLAGLNAGRFSRSL